MRISHRLLIASALTFGLAASAQVSSSEARFSPQTSGYLERARVMRGEGNYAGVIDQLRHLNTQSVTLSATEAEEYTFLIADAYYQRGDSRCLKLLTDFVETYPASSHAPEASAAIADFYFFRHEWPEALEAYNALDLDRLNRDKCPIYTYRKALAMIKTGHFSEARPLVTSLKGVAGYKDVYYFYTAYLDYIDGNFNQAYELFEKVTPDTDGMEAAYYLTQIDYSRGEYQTVINRGTSLLRRRPVAELEPEMNRIVGLSYFKTGDFAEARPYLAKYMAAIDGNPSPDAQYALGAIEYADGDYASAALRFSAVTSQNSAVGQGAWLYLGQCYLHQDNPSSAAIAFEKASKMDFDNNVRENALYNYVTALTRGGKVPFSSAASLLEKFAREYPDSKYAPEVETYLATAYYNDRNYAKALECIDAIRNPDNSVRATRQKILYELGVEAVTNGRSAEAVKYLGQAAAMRSLDRDLAAQASLWLGDAYFSLNNFIDARKSYEDFIRFDRSRENRALGYYDLAYAKYKLKDYRGAATDFKSALSATPALQPGMRHDAMIRRADCLYYSGNYHEAEPLYSEAITGGATDSDYALYRRALLSGLSGDSKSKLSDLSRIESEFPDSRWLSKALLEEAMTYEAMGQSDRAADAYKKRLGVASDVDIDELLRMATSMREAGRSADLLEVLDRISHAGGLEPDERAELSLYEADALADLDCWEEAAPIYRQLAENPTSLAGSKAAVMLADRAFASGDYESARDSMEQFTETGTPHQYWLARGFIILADAYHALGEKSLAREYILSLSENYPGNEEDIKSMISTRLKKWK